MSELLQELIVRIKYEENAASKSSMLNGLKGTAGAIENVAKVGIGLATVVAASTYKIAQGINSLYLTSHNMGNSTIRTLKSITQAAEDVGDSVEGMTSALQGLNKFQKTTGEGANRYIAQFAGANFKPGMSAPDTMLEIVKNIPSLKASGMTQEYFYAAMDQMNIPFETAQPMWENNKEFLSQQEKHKAAIGTEVDKMAPGIHGQMERFSIDMDKTLSAGAVAFGDSLQKVIDLELKGFEWAIDGFEKHSGEIKDSLKIGMDALGGNYKLMSEKFDRMDLSLSGINKSFSEFVHPLEYLKDAITGLGPSLETIFVKLIEGVGFIFGGKMMLDALKGVSFFTTAGAAKAANMGKAFAPKAALGVGIATYSATKWGNELLGNPAGKLGIYAYEKTHDILGNNTLSQGLEKSLNPANIGKNIPLNVRLREQTGIESLREMGMSNIDSAAVMANITRENGKLDPFAEGDKNKKGEYEAYGLLQWHADRQKNYEKVFGHSMKSVVDADKAFAEQMEFINIERQTTEKGAWNKMQNVENDPYHRGAAFSQYYVRPGDVEGEKSARGQAALGYAQQYGDVHITVSGVSDPQEAAKLVQERLENKTKMQQRYSVQSHQ
jgi:hypothetical protein